MRKASQNSKERPCSADAEFQPPEEKLSLLEGLADALPVLISHVDREFRYRFSNAANRSWFHLNKKALAGKHVRGVLGEEAWRILKPYMVAALKGEHCSFERAVPYKTRGLRDVQVDYVPHREDSGKVAGFYALIRDATKQKRLEQDLRNRVRRASPRRKKLPG